MPNVAGTGIIFSASGPARISVRQNVFLPAYGSDTLASSSSPPGVLLGQTDHHQQHPALSLSPRNSVRASSGGMGGGSGNSATPSPPPLGIVQQNYDMLDAFHAFEDSRSSLANLAADVKRELAQEQSPADTGALIIPNVPAGSGFPTTFTLPQTDGLGRSTSARFRHSRNNSVCSEENVSFAAGSRAGVGPDDSPAAEDSKPELKKTSSSAKARGSPKDPSKVAEQKQQRSLKKREASKRRYMDQKQKMDELKARADDLQVVNVQLKKDLASVYREIERLQKQQSDDIFASLAQ